MPDVHTGPRMMPLLTRLENLKIYGVLSGHTGLASMGRERRGGGGGGGGGGEEHKISPRVITAPILLNKS